MSRIIISDPHGCYKTLMALMAQLPSGVPVTFAGDLIDRGPDSRKIIDFVRSGGYDCVVGNHEIMMAEDIKFFDQDDVRSFQVPWGSVWLYNGGNRCLANYATTDKGDHDIDALKKDIEWIKSLPYFILYENEVNERGEKLLVTHTTAANVWGKVTPDTRQFKDTVTWDRVPFPAKIDGIFNVYGHTPQRSGATVKDHFACIDTGAYYTREGMGLMTALEFPSMRIYTQANIEGL